MPSAEHESPVALARMDPGLLAWLLSNLFQVKVPAYDHARPHATDVRVMVPHTYHADSMVLFWDTADRPLLATVFEIQRGWDLAKRRTWKLYVAQLEAELNVAVPDEVRDQILECTDTSQLDIWLRRAITATTVDDVIHG